MRISKWIGGLVSTAGIVGIGVGVVVGVPLLDTVDQVFSSNAFCANTCHVMTATVATEFNQSAHGKTHTGVVPKCHNCHISNTLVGAMVDHVKGLSDLYSYTIKGIRTPEEFETVRFDAANKVRMGFVANDSANCRSCHIMDKIVPEKKRGQRQHAEAKEKDITCIVCHYNLVHKEVELSAEFDKVVGEF